MSRRHVFLLPASIAALLAGCAGTGATFRSGVGDTFLAHAPWYAGAKSSPVRDANVRVGIHPVHFQPRDGQSAVFEPSVLAGRPVAALIAEMNDYLDSLTTANATTPIRLVDGRRISAVPPTAHGIAPDVRFGCITEGNLPGNDCVARGDSALGRTDLQRMQLSVGRPSPDWVEWTREAMTGANVTHTLVITLEVGEHLLRQRGLLGRKQLELGTGYTVEQPWLTSLSTPVQVLQLTGVLIDRDGRAVRIGAEGIVARRTRLLLSAAGAQELITDDDVNAARTVKRTDLPGEPLAWRVALRTLVLRLTT